MTWGNLGWVSQKFASRFLVKKLFAYSIQCLGITHIHVHARIIQLIV